MRRTTVSLEPELEIQLKLEAIRQKRPVSDVLREALRVYLGGRRADAPPGAGAFTSGFVDTAERAEEVLVELGFGQGPG